MPVVGKFTTALRHFVSFELNNEKYAIPVENVKEIVREAVITRLPLAAEYVAGLMNLRGAIVPVIDLKKRLELVSEGLSSKIMVVSYQNRLMGLLIDRALQVVVTDETAIKESIGNGDQIIQGVIEMNGELVFVLDLSKVFVDAVDVNENRVVEKKNIHSLAKQQERIENGVDKESIQLITFFLSDDIYAFKMETIREIIRFKNVTRVPGTEEYVRGIIKLRESVLPVVDLKMLLFNEPSSTTELTKIIVTQLYETVVGFVVDKISGVIKLESNCLKPPPKVGNFGHKDELIGVVNLGERLILVIDPSKLVGESVSQLYKSAEHEEVKTQEVDERQFLIFKVCETYFAVPIEEVQEVNRLSKTTRIPGVPKYIEGLMNLRGEVLPVLNLRIRLGFGEGVVSNVTPRVLVDEIRGKFKAAFVVDAIEGVEKFPKDLIEDVPETMSYISSAISKVVKHPERTVLVLDTTKVFSEDDFEKISKTFNSFPEPMKRKYDEVIDESIKERVKTSESMKTPSSASTKAKNKQKRAK